MKVLHVVGAMNRAGTESMLMNVYRKINRGKIQFDFVSYANEEADFDREIESLGGQIITLSKTNSITQLYNVIKRNGPYDVVHAHTLFHCGIVCFASFLAGVHVRIAHAHTTADDSNHLLRKLYILMMRVFIYLFATNKLACSGDAGSYLFGKKSVLKQNYRYFPNVIDDKAYSSVSKSNINKFKSEVGISNNHFVIGHIGTFKKSKNHHFLIKVLENLVENNVNVLLLLIGEGELKQEIEEITRQKGIFKYVKFLGKREDIPTILHSLNVFIFPSLYEGLGMVLLEAQASGLPCIVSEAIPPEADVGIGLVEKVSLNKGPAIWAKKVIQKASTKEKNRKNSKNAKSTFESGENSLTNSMEILQEIYRIA